MSLHGTPELRYPESTPTPSAPQCKREPIDNDYALLHRRSPSYHPRSPTPDSYPNSGPTISLCPTPPTSLARTPTLPTMTGRLLSPVTERATNSPERGPGVYPGPPWMCWHDLPGIPTYAINDNGEMKALPYISFQEVLGQTFQVGTTGMGCPTYSREVLLGPSDPIPNSTVDDHDLDYFIKDPTFNFVVNQAIKSLDDPGLTAEVARLRAMHLQLPAIVERANLVEQLMRSFQAFHESHHARNQTFMTRLDACKNHLITRRARSQVERAAIEITRRGEAGGCFYWPSLPGYPEHPSRFPQTCQEQIIASGVERWVEEQDRQEEKDARERANYNLAQRRRKHRCKWCRKRGHFNKDCPVPHTECNVYCKVPGTHQRY